MPSLNKATGLEEENLKPATVKNLDGGLGKVDFKVAEIRKLVSRERETDRQRESK